MLDGIALGRLSPVISDELRFRDIGRAHALPEGGGALGKLVLVPDAP